MDPLLSLAWTSPDPFGPHSDKARVLAGLPIPRLSGALISVILSQRGDSRSVFKGVPCLGIPFRSGALGLLCLCWGSLRLSLLKQSQHALPSLRFRPPHLLLIWHSRGKHD